MMVWNEDSNGRVIVSVPDQNALPKDLALPGLTWRALHTQCWQDVAP